MKGYVVCVYKSINDENALKNYAIKAKIAVEKYKGKFLIRGGKKITTEGEESPRTAVIEFPSFAEAEKENIIAIMLIIICFIEFLSFDLLYNIKLLKKAYNYYKK